MGECQVHTEGKSGNLVNFGFRFNRSSVHIGRTIMLEDLKVLLAVVDNPNSPKNDYLKAIVADNCLGKQTLKTRELSGKHLAFLMLLILL